MESIETEYAGYRFRSRLEARWAVFFDEAEVDYNYEAEGFSLPWALTPSWSKKGRLRYLPDFWLPGLGWYAEVKGRWSQADKVRTLNAIFALDEPTLVMGDTFRQPRQGSRRPWLLESTDSALTVRPWPFLDEDDEPEALATTDGWISPTDLLRGCTTDLEAPEWFRDASKAAQRARFEFGETPGREWPS